MVFGKLGQLIIRVHRWKVGDQNKHTRFRCETLGRSKGVKRFTACFSWYHEECAQVISTVISHQDDLLRCTDQVVDEAGRCLPVYRLPTWLPTISMIKFLKFSRWRLLRHGATIFSPSFREGKWGTRFSRWARKKNEQKAGMLAKWWILMGGPNPSNHRADVRAVQVPGETTKLSYTGIPPSATPGKKAWLRDY